MLLLLWKNFLVRRRSLGWTITEIVIPILLTGSMVGLRQLVDVKNKNETTYAAFPVTGSVIDLGFYASPDNCFFPTSLAYTPNNSDTVDQIMRYAAQFLCPNSSHIGADVCNIINGAGYFLLQPNVTGGLN